MTGRTSLARLVALSVAWAIAVGSSIAVMAISSAVESTSGDGADPDTFAVTIAVLTLITSSVGWFLVARRPGNLVGLLLATGSTLLSWAFIGYGVAVVRVVSHGPDDPLGALASVIGQALIVPAIFLTFVVSVILFPDGRLPGATWRWPFRAIVLAIVISTMLGVAGPWEPEAGLPPNPVALPLPLWVSALAGGLGGLGLIVGLAMGAAAILVRFRRSTGIERAQVKWLLAALGVATLVFPLSWVTDIGPDEGGLVDILSILAMSLVPLAILVAILRYRLYDIDRIVSRTVSWALISGGLLAIFAAMVIGLQAALDDVTQGATAAIAVSTLVAAALFQPVRRRVQRAVDRRFDRARFDAERLAAVFAERTRNEVDVDRLLGGLTETTDVAVRPARAGVWLRPRPTTATVTTPGVIHGS
jgi:hypothetical protein